MPAPTYVANGGLVGIGTTALTTTATYPAGLAQGDIAFLLVHNDNHSVLSVPGGWTACGAQEDTSGNVSARLWWRRLNGTETGTVTLTRGTGATNEWFGGTIAVYRGCTSSGVPFEGYGTVLSVTTTMNSPAITTTGSDRLAVLFWCQGDNLASAPTGAYTENFELLDAAGNDGGQIGDSRTVATAQTIAAATRTLSLANPSVGFGLALLPVSTTPQPSVTLLISETNPSPPTPVTTGSFTPTAALPLIVLVATRKGAAITALAQATIANSGTDLGWSAPIDVVLLGTLPSSIRLTAFAAFAPTPTRALTISCSASDATFMHVVVLQFANVLADYSNFDTDSNTAGDLALTLPITAAATSLSLLVTTVANVDGAINPPPFYANPSGWIELYNFTRASTVNGVNPIALYVGSKINDSAETITTTGGTTVGALLELKSSATAVAPPPLSSVPPAIMHILAR